MNQGKTWTWPRGVNVALVLAATAAAAAAHAQSTLERTPNLAGGWVGDGGRLDFHFLHRFNHSGPPQRQVQSRPTFLLAWEISGRALAGVRYATRSALTAAVPNEWEAFARVQPLRAGVPAEAALEVGYNTATRSVDAELSATRAFGPVRPLVAFRRLGQTPEGTGSAFVGAAGLVLRPWPGVAVAADAGHRLTRAADTRTFWGIGLQLQVPHSPHTVSLHAANTDAVTLQSASRAGAATRWGFEFTVPVTPSRYFGRARAAASAAAGDTTVVLRDLQFRPAEIRVPRGAVIAWHNLDPLAHTVSAVDGTWDSGLIPPQGRWQRRFERPGRYEIYCVPHPFMRAVVIVE